jgi:hypothetical protein
LISTANQNDSTSWQNVQKYRLFISTCLILQLLRLFFHLVEDTKISATVMIKIKSSGVLPGHKEQLTVVVVDGVFDRVAVDDGQGGTDLFAAVDRAAEAHVVAENGKLRPMLLTLFFALAE